MELEIIVDKAKNGDKASMEEIIMRFKPLIIKHAKSTFISGLDENDFMQMGYLTIIKAIKRYDKNKSNNFIGYIFYALRNNYFYEIRQKCRYKSEISLNKPIGEGIELGDELKDPSNLEYIVFHNECLYKVFEVINSLPSDEKNLIKFIYIEQKSLVEYCKVKNINYNTAAKRKERILLKLKKKLTND